MERGSGGCCEGVLPSFYYSQTSPQWLLWGQKKVAEVERWSLWGGRGLKHDNFF